VPGIVFLSGGQRDEDATANLDAVNRAGPQPWQLSFSYGRALQGAALEAWAGVQANVNVAQAIFARRAEVTSAARRGALAGRPALAPVS
jgi:fructose-bisphosphate aldolase class I